MSRKKKQTQQSQAASSIDATGPRLQMLTSDADANRRIEHAFMVWSRSINLAEKLRTMRMARATDGESFAILTNNPRLNTEVQLDLRLVEADQVTTPDLDQLSTIAVDGIVFDSAGNPVEYHVLRTHPGDGFYSARSDYDRIPADAAVTTDDNRRHWANADGLSPNASNKDEQSFSCAKIVNAEFVPQLSDQHYQEVGESLAAKIANSIGIPREILIVNAKPKGDRKQ